MTSKTLNSCNTNDSGEKAMDDDQAAETVFSFKSRDAFSNKFNAHDLDPTELRRVASMLISLADASEEIITISENSHLSRFAAEARRPRLANIARRFHIGRERRRKYVSGKLLGEPAWDILLDLFYHGSTGKRVTVTDAHNAAHAPFATTLRYIEFMEADGLITRVASQTDKRVRFIELTDEGLHAMAGYLADMDEFDRIRDLTKSTQFRSGHK